MATKNIADFRTEVDFYAKGASGDTAFIDGQIIRTLRDWCRETWHWRMTLDAFDCVDETSQYTLTIPTDDGAAELWMVDWLKWKVDAADDSQYVFVEPIVLEEKETQMGPNMSAGWWYEEGDNPRAFWIAPDKTLNIRPIPNSSAAGTENLLCKVIVIPGLATTKVPDYLYLDWVEEIAKGVAGRILNMASKKWYQPDLADRYMREYQEARDAQQKQKYEGKTRHRSYVRPLKAFSGGHRQRSWGY